MHAKPLACVWLTCDQSVDDHGRQWHLNLAYTASTMTCWHRPAVPARCPWLTGWKSRHFRAVTAAPVISTVAAADHRECTQSEIHWGSSNSGGQETPGSRPHIQILQRSATARDRHAMHRGRGHRAHQRRSVHHYSTDSVIRFERGTMKSFVRRRSVTPSV